MEANKYIKMLEERRNGGEGLSAQEQDWLIDKIKDFNSLEKERDDYFHCLEGVWNCLTDTPTLQDYINENLAQHNKFIHRDQNCKCQEVFKGHDHIIQIKLESENGSQS